jgi:predicted house-cleaning noncanonical NTP pyrophosphatase (MazG superfamily)
MHYNKLVRDKIPEILDKKGVLYEKKVANDFEYREELIKKLLEETNEFFKDKSVEELADVMEVVEALKSLPEFDGVEHVRLEKLEEKGGFSRKYIVSGNK